MSEFIRTYALYLAALLSFIFGMMVGHWKGRIAGMQEQAETMHRADSNNLWKEMMDRFKEEKP